MMNYELRIVWAFPCGSGFSLRSFLANLLIDDFRQFVIPTLGGISSAKKGFPLQM